MTISSRTPGGQPNQCPVCGAVVCIEPAKPFGDAPCPACGQLLWFTRHRDGVVFYDPSTATAKKAEVRAFIASQLGVELSSVPSDLEELDLASLGGDSLDTVELAMELEQEFDIYAE